jgi:hypothetical protein
VETVRPDQIVLDFVNLPRLRASAAEVKGLCW